jgi:hypothetical protein
MMQPGAILFSVLQGNLNKNVPQQKMPEERRRSMQPGKLSRPSVRH